MLTAQAAAQSDDLLTRVWSGVQQAQAKFTTACGTVVETRTSKLMVKPMVLRGKFCAEGMTRFSLEYSAPNALAHPLQRRLSQRDGGDGKTEVLEIGSGVRRAQSAFSRESSIVGLKKNFTITATENSREYELKFVPRSRGLSPPLELSDGEARQARLSAALAGGGRQERSEQRLCDRLHLAERQAARGELRGDKSQSDGAQAKSRAIFRIVRRFCGSTGWRSWSRAVAAWPG